jgi:hypothetical protein
MQVVEDMLLTLSGDDSEAVTTAVSGQLLPVSLAWAAEADVVPNSLLPKVVSEMGKTLRQAVAQYGSGDGNDNGVGAVPRHLMQQQQQPVVFPNHDFQVGLLHMF